MNTRTLGKTGLQVSELALGGLFISNYGAAYEQGRETILRALALGVNFIDTAPTYGNSEEVLGRVLEGFPSPLILSTKLGGRPVPFRPQDGDDLRRSVEESLRLLKRDRIDILFIHEPDRPRQYDWWTDHAAFRGPVLEVLDDLKREGVIGFTGVAGTTVYEMARIIRAGAFDIVLTAFNYSLLWREAEWAVIPAAVERGMGIVVGSPLQQGALAARYDDEVNRGAPWLSPPRRAQFRALYSLLDDLKMPLPELGLRFVLSNSAVSCVLTGVRSLEEIEGNVEAVAKGPLPGDVLARLDEIAAMVPFRPYEEPALLPFGREYSGPGMLR